jgi:hypothetical protein
MRRGALADEWRRHCILRRGLPCTDYLFPATVSTQTYACAHEPPTHIAVRLWGRGADAPPLPSRLARLHTLALAQCQCHPHAAHSHPHVCPLRSPSRSSSRHFSRPCGRCSGASAPHGWRRRAWTSAGRRTCGVIARGAGASLIGLFPRKFPEGRISQHMFMSHTISGNLGQAQIMMEDEWCVRQRPAVWRRAPSPTV